MRSAVSNRRLTRTACVHINYPQSFAHARLWNRRASHAVLRRTCPLLPYQKLPIWVIQGNAAKNSSALFIKLTVPLTRSVCDILIFHLQLYLTNNQWFFTDVCVVRWLRWSTVVRCDASGFQSLPLQNEGVCGGTSP